MSHGKSHISSHGYNNFHGKLWHLYAKYCVLHVCTNEVIIEWYRLLLDVELGLIIVMCNTVRAMNAVFLLSQRAIAAMQKVIAKMDT